MLRFKDYLNKIEEQNVPGAYDGPGGPYLSSTWSGSFGDNRSSALDDIPADQDTNDIGVPIVRKEGRIVILDQSRSLGRKQTQSPIFIQLEDGTRLYLTRNEFDRIKGEVPEKGKVLSVTFQRNITDKTQNYSQIESITCRSA